MSLLAAKTETIVGAQRGDSSWTSNSQGMIHSLSTQHRNPVASPAWVLEGTQRRALMDTPMLTTEHVEKTPNADPPPSTFHISPSPKGPWWNLARSSWKEPSSGIPDPIPRLNAHQIKRSSVVQESLCLCVSLGTCLEDVRHRGMLPALSMFSGG